MTALTVGVTTAKYPECKRGVATNVAACLARHSAVSDRVCVARDRGDLGLVRLALAIPELDDAVADLLAGFLEGRDHALHFLPI